MRRIIVAIAVALLLGSVSVAESVPASAAPTFSHVVTVPFTGDQHVRLLDPFVLVRAPGVRCQHGGGSCMGDAAPGWLRHVRRSHFCRHLCHHPGRPGSPHRNRVGNACQPESGYVRGSRRSGVTRLRPDRQQWTSGHRRHACRPHRGLVLTRQAKRRRADQRHPPMGPPRDQNASTPTSTRSRLSPGHQETGHLCVRFLACFGARFSGGWR